MPPAPSAQANTLETPRSLRQGELAPVGTELVHLPKGYWSQIVCCMYQIVLPYESRQRANFPSFILLSSLSGDPRAHRLTKNCSGGDRFPVQPEGDLGQDYSHDAGQVGLDDEVPDLPLEVKVCGHDNILP